MSADQPVDFRSDTVTLPPEKMLEAMVRAQVGDDVWRDDPTVRTLEEEAAHLLGKEAGLFVPSGTMGNQVAIATVTHPGDEVIAEARSHVYNYEVGGLARLSGVQVRAIRGIQGRMPIAEVARAFQPDDVHCPRTRVIALEQTHMASGGRVLPLEYTDAIATLAREHGLHVHVDGARFFHAVRALTVTPERVARCADSLTFCLSKGLSAPVGSVLVGTQAFVDEARRVRKMLGGGMRQAGYLAACGLYALHHQIERLDEDHANARRLAEGLAALPGHPVEPADCETNLCLLPVPGGKAGHYVESLQRRGFLVSTLGTGTLRFVTHRHVSAHDVDRLLMVLREIWVV